MRYAQFPHGGHSRPFALYILSSPQNRQASPPDGSALSDRGAAPQSEKDDGKDDADDGENPGDAGCCAGDPRETEDCGDQRDDKEYDGPIQHDSGLLISN